MATVVVVAVVVAVVVGIAAKSNEKMKDQRIKPRHC
jgi:mannitol/fructose-specific phosphotransferase system IIA component